MAKWAILLLQVLLACVCLVRAETEVKFTRNEQDDVGPLPLSQNQRNQLSQLEQAIVNSPDPQATLKQAAQANNMDPQELASLLNRNHQEMQAAGGGGGGQPALSTWPKTVAKVLTSLGVVISQVASKNPRAFAVASVALLMMLIIMLRAPR